MEIILIAAIAANGVIGRNGTLPWYLPDDLAHFKKTTMGHPVIMGRVAFDDVIDHLGEPLPGRTNIVLSRSNPDVSPTVIVAHSVDAALEAASATGTDTVYVAGGATVYEQFFDIADRMILTELEESYDGDVTFPEWDQRTWREHERTQFEEFAIVEYERVDPA